jgi:histone H2B
LKHFFQTEITPDVPVVARLPAATVQILARSKGGPGSASRRKLKYPPVQRKAIRKSGRKKVDFKNALFRVLRKIDNKGTISSKAMDVMNDMMGDLLERFAREAGAICDKNQKKTLRTRDVQTAARLLLPGSLFSHAFYEAHHCLGKLIQFDERARLARAFDGQ